MKSWEEKKKQWKKEGKCVECGHALEHHTKYGCRGSYPNGTEGISPMEVFYGECHCSHQPKK